MSLPLPLEDAQVVSHAAMRWVNCAVAQAWAEARFVYADPSLPPDVVRSLNRKSIEAEEARRRASQAFYDVLHRSGSEPILEDIREQEKGAA